MKIGNQKWSQKECKITNTENTNTNIKNKKKIELHNSLKEFKK